MLWKPGIVTREFEAMTGYARIAVLGDEGSMVTNEQGELVGLLFAIDYGNNYGSALMTPIAAVQQNVREMTDGGFLSLD